MEQLNLTQEWDKVFPKSDKVDHKKVTFHNRSIARTAEELFIHKNTVQTQLNRIYERTGYNPKDSKDLTLLYATTHMYEMGTRMENYAK